MNLRWTTNNFVVYVPTIAWNINYSLFCNLNLTGEPLFYLAILPIKAKNKILAVNIIKICTVKKTINFSRGNNKTNITVFEPSLYARCCSNYFKLHVQTHVLTHLTLPAMLWSVHNFIVRGNAVTQKLNNIPRPHGCKMSCINRYITPLDWEAQYYRSVHSPKINL